MTRGTSLAWWEDGGVGESLMYLENCHVGKGAALLYVDLKGRSEVG